MFAWLRNHLVKGTRRPVRQSNYLPRLEVLEARLALASLAWTGAAGAVWSDPDNWSPQQRPSIGDDLTFPDDAQNKINFNDLLSGRNYRSIRFSGSGGYTITGNRIELNQDDVASINSSGGTNFINLPVEFDGGGNPRSYEIRVGTGGTLVINGVISGGFAQLVSKEGEGNLILNAANTFTMPLFIDEGTVTVQNGAALGGTQGLDDTFIDGGTLVLQNNITLPEEIIVEEDGGGIRSASGNNTITGLVQIQRVSTSEASRITVDAGSKLTLTDLRDRSTFGDVEGGFEKFGGGELVLPNASTIQEDSTIFAGRVTILNNNSLGTTEGETKVLGNAVLAVTGTRTIAEKLNLSGADFAGGPAAELFATNNSNVTWNGQVIFGGNARLRVTGSDTKLKLSQAVTLSDDLIVTGGGTVELAGGIVLPQLTNVDLSLAAGATLNVPGGLRGSGQLNIDNDSAAGGTVVLGGPGAFTHTGTINVNGATLDANASIASQIVVNGGTLRGVGTVANLNALSGVVDPGGSRPGRLSVANNATLGSASTFHVDLGDQLRVTGAVNLQNAVLTVIENTFGTPVGTAFTIIDNLGSDAVIGQLAGLNEGAIFAVDAAVGPELFQITYQGFSGNDVVITRVNTGTLAPGIAITPSIQEGQVAHLTGHLVDPDRGDRLTLVVDWGDGSKPQTFRPGTKDFDITHRYRDNPVGTSQYSVRTSWFDNHGDGNSRDLAVSVANVAPVLTKGDVRSAGNNQVLLSGSFVDPGEDSYTLVIHWGDGQSTTLQLAKGREHFQVQHRYENAGRYQISLSLADDDGGQDNEAMIVDLASRGQQSDSRRMALLAILGTDDDDVGG